MLERVVVGRCWWGVADTALVVSALGSKREDWMRMLRIERMLEQQQDYAGCAVRDARVRDCNVIGNCRDQLDGHAISATALLVSGASSLPCRAPKESGNSVSWIVSWCGMARVSRALQQSVVAVQLLP
jgi:hypothetical protein